MSEHWSAQKEKGNRFALHLLKWIALNFGRRVVLWALVPVTVYFVLFAASSRRASERYLAKVYQRTPTWREVWRHFYTFAVVSVDRFYFLSDNTADFQVTLSGEEIFKPFVDNKQGCILLVSHLGSFDVMCAPSIGRYQLPIRFLIDKQHNARAMGVLETLAPELAQNVLDAKQFPPELSLTLDQCLKQGEFIGIMADRAALKDKVSPVKFLGETALLPTGPWLLGLVLRVPIILCFALYKGKGEYTVNFERIDSLIDVPRKLRHQAIETAVTNYAQRLEFYSQQAPYNWFNFYEFWSDETTTNN